MLQAAAASDGKGKGLPILDLFEIGKDKNNRPTELIFVERCLNLLKPGGRMGIVLPDGNLNNPSLAWLRRWAEGRAKLLAVVSLPEETFRSSNATVKASLVFLQRFTEADALAWAAAWTQAHAELDVTFDALRDARHADYAERIVSGDDSEAARLLAELAALGVTRCLPAWQRGEPPAYPRAIGPTQQGKPAWQGKADKAHRKAAAKLKRRLQARLAAVQKTCDARLSELKALFRALDESHTAALWTAVRERFDYPVFVAAPRTVGITSTGETGEGVANDLPALSRTYREYEAWTTRIARPENILNSPELKSFVACRWKNIERWSDTGFASTRKTLRAVVPLRELLAERREPLSLDGDMGEWKAITIKFSGEIVPRDRDRVFKGAMFAAYSGDLVFSKIDARNGAVGLVPENIPKAVVTSEYPVMQLNTELMRPAFLRYLLRADHFQADLRRRASGTSGRKRVTLDGFLNLEVPVPTITEQDLLLTPLLRAASLRREAEILEHEGQLAFESALFISIDPA